MNDEIRNLEYAVLLDPQNYQLRSQLVYAYQRLGYNLETSFAPLIDPLIARLNTFPLAQEVFQLITLYTGGSEIYLVGGKIYRNLIELLHFINVNAESKDWDFLCLGIPIKPANTSLPVGWREIKFYRGNFTIRLKHESGITVDIISIYDAATIMNISFNTVANLLDTKQYYNAVEIYFQSVPLDSQATALDLSTEHLFGDVGLQSVFNLSIKLKRPESLLMWDIDPDNYLAHKLYSMNLGPKPTQPEPKHEPPEPPEPELPEEPPEFYDEDWEEPPF